MAVQYCGPWCLWRIYDDDHDIHKRGLDGYYCACSVCARVRWDKTIALRHGDEHKSCPTDPQPETPLA